MTVVRTPTSTPVASTSGSTRSTGVTPSVGSTVIVAPRASLLWKPRPTLTNSSVSFSFHGPSTTDAFGLTIDQFRGSDVVGVFQRSHLEPWVAVLPVATSILGRITQIRDSISRASNPLVLVTPGSDRQLSKFGVVVTISSVTLLPRNKPSVMVALTV